MGLLAIGIVAQDPARKLSRGGRVALRQPPCGESVAHRSEEAPKPLALGFDLLRIEFAAQLAPVERQGRLQRRRVIAGRQPLELAKVHRRALVQDEVIPASLDCLGRRAQRTTQPPEGVAQVVAGVRLVALRPEPGNQGVARHRLSDP